jgi:hypothetical protein
VHRRLVKALIGVSWISIASSSQEDPDSKNGIDWKKENMSDSTEEED